MDGREKLIAAGKVTEQLDLEAIKRRYEAATEAPWPDNGADSWRWVGMSRAQLQRNRHFIAHARSDVPALVGEVERLTERLEKFREMCQVQAPFDADACVRCSQYHTCLTEYESAFTRL